MAGAPQPLVPTASVLHIVPVVATLDAQGVDPKPLLARMGLGRADLTDPDRRVSIRDGQRLLETAVELTGDAAFGLHVAEQIEPESVSLFIYLAATSATPREAFHRSARYLRLMNDVMRLALSVQDERTVCSMHFSPPHAMSSTSAEISISSMIRLSRLVTGEAPSIEAWFRHAEPDYVDEYERVLGVPVRFDAPCNGLVGDRMTLDDPLPHADSALCQLLDEHARELLARLPDTKRFSDQVRAAVAKALPAGNPHAEAVAEALGMSPRTLRRRLREEDTSHQSLLDEVREGLARSYFRERQLSVMEVAFLLGFSDASAFHKAFRRWTGKSPGEFLRAAS